MQVFIGSALLSGEKGVWNCFIIIFSFFFFSVLIWETHTMLNACVYIDIWSNASSIYLLWQMQNQHKAHIQRNLKKVIICNAESPVTMSYMWKKRQETFVHAKTYLRYPVQTKLYYFHCFVFLVSDARFLWVSFFLSVMQCMHYVLPFLFFIFCILGERWNLFVVCASDWWPFIHFITLHVLFFSHTTCFRKKKKKSEAAFVFC